MSAIGLGWVFSVLAAICPGELAPVDVQRDLRVPMRDGVVLVGDLWQPTEAAEALPVILARSPYGRHFEDHVGEQWASEGYAVFIQAVRGRDGSEGVWVPWENELEDGYDTLEWITGQPWCNGRIGMTGGSYLGHVQILAAASGHPALRCIVPLSPGSDGFSDVPFSGGILNIGLISWLYTCRDPVMDTSGRSAPGANRRNLQLLPLSRIDEAYAGFRSDIWQHWVSVQSLADMPGLDPWKRLAALDRVVPALHIGGIWDGESMATRRNWEQFDALGGAHQHLVYGPWPHEPNQSSSYGGVDYGPEATIELTRMRIDWYDHWLRGGGAADSRDGIDLPRVQQFVTGANTWLHTDSWPAPDATARTFYLGDPVGSGKRSRSRRYQPALSEQAPGDTVRLTWTHDPAVTARGSRDLGFSSSTRLWFEDTDDDALVLVTPVFEEDTLLTGPVELELTLGSSAPDTDLFALLVEVDRKGVVRALQRPSPLRVRFREGFDRVVRMEVGETYRVVLPLARFAHLFRAGTRLGIGVRSEWFHGFARNLGTLEPQRTATRMVVQENHILSGGGELSALRLHELPVSALAPPASRSISAGLSPAEVDAWREDIDFFTNALETQHVDLFRFLSRDAYREHVAALQLELPGLARHEVLVRMLEIIALLHDGHSALVVNDEAGGFRKFPLILRRFADGWFVATAMEPNGRAVGRRVVAIDGMPVEDVYRAVAPSISADNDFFQRWSSSGSFTTPEVLAAYGVIADMERATYLLEDADGGREQITVEPRPRREVVAFHRAHAKRLWKHPSFTSDATYDFTLLEESGTLLVDFSSVMDAESGESIADFVKRLERFVKRNDFERVVLDMRTNGGGSANNAIPLVTLFSENPKINRAGRLFTITGSGTYSAAVLTTAMLENRTRTLFVGEPVGQSPNLLGDAVVLELPRSGIPLRISHRYWQTSHAEDPRTTFTPDIPVPLTHADAVAGRDACLEQILAYAWEPPPVVPLEVREARRYEGRYRFGPYQSLELALELTRRGSDLSYTLHDHIAGSAWLMHAVSDLHPVGDGFQTDTRGVTLEYAPGEGPVPELIVHWQGVRVRCPRLPDGYRFPLERIDGGNVGVSSRGPTIPRNHEARIRGTTAQDAREPCAELLEHRQLLSTLPMLEDRLNIAGYSWLHHGEEETAAVVLETNTKLFPRSWNTWDSLGEALMELGRREEAIAHYERSLELNPDNDGGRTMLARLRR